MQSTCTGIVSSSGGEVRNNIVMAHDVCYNVPAPTLESHNTAHTSCRTGFLTTMNANSVVRSPRFFDEDVDDYTLSSSSQELNSGFSTGAMDPDGYSPCRGAYCSGSFVLRPSVAERFIEQRLAAVATTGLPPLGNYWWSYPNH